RSRSGLVVLNESRRLGRLLELGLEQVEDVADGDEPLQLGVGQADVEAALDLRDDADDVHRVEAEALAKLIGLLQVLKMFAGVRLEQLDERAADGLAVVHALTLPGQMRESPLPRKQESTPPGAARQEELEAGGGGRCVDFPRGRPYHDRDATAPHP